MREREFTDWLKAKRGLQDNTAASYAGRAAAIESKLGGDLDTHWARSALKAAFDQVETDADLGTKTRADYKTALNAYAEFCAG